MTNLISSEKIVVIHRRQIQYQLKYNLLYCALFSPPMYVDRDVSIGRKRRGVFFVQARLSQSTAAVKRSKEKR